MTARPASSAANAAATSTPAADPAVRALAHRAATICLDNKGQDVVMIDLAGISDMTDFFVVASGTSDTHVRSMADHVMEELRKDGFRAHHVEGLAQGRWVLLDYVDFVVHLFHPTLRSFYQLERLWSDAEITPVKSQESLK